MATQIAKPSLARQFRAFLLEQNALALAVGVIIGGAVASVVTGLVNDVFMPLLGLVLPPGEWRNAQVLLARGNALKYGDLIGRCVDFVIIALVVFLATRSLLASAKKPAPVPATKACPQCLESIPAAATRCRACGQPV